MDIMRRQSHKMISEISFLEKRSKFHTTEESRIYLGHRILQYCSTLRPSKLGPPFWKLKQYLEFSFMCMIVIVIIVSKIMKQKSI